MSEPNEKAFVAQILSSYLSNNTVAAADLPSVIETVKNAFGGSEEAVSTTPSDSVTKTWQPAVPVKKSVTPDAVICLCCGQRFKTLRRHLQTTHQLKSSRVSRRLRPEERLSDRCAELRGTTVWLGEVARAWS